MIHNHLKAKNSEIVHMVPFDVGLQDWVLKKEDASSTKWTSKNAPLKLDNQNNDIVFALINVRPYLLITIKIRKTRTHLAT